MLWEHSLVMVDEETGSLWSHLLGEAMQGPLTGERLEPLPATMTDWKTWRHAHPMTSAALLPRSERRLRRDSYRELDRYVIGLAEDGIARAWPFDLLLQHSLVNDWLGDDPVLVVFDQASLTAVVYERTINGRPIEFEEQNGRLVDPQTDTDWDPLTGRSFTTGGVRLQRLPGVTSFAHSWRRFHPGTTFWREK